MPITPIDLTLRNVKGSAVTATENDANLTNLKTASEELDANKIEDVMTTRGDMIVRDATNATNRLAIGTVGQVLTSDGTDIVWSASPAGVTDHTLLTNIGTNTHAQIDSHIAVALVDADIGVNVQAYDADIVSAPLGVLPILDGSNLTNLPGGTGDAILIVKPSITSPLDGAIDTDIAITVTGSTYATSALYDGAKDSELLEVATDSAFTNIVHSGIFTASGLIPSTLYYARIRYGSDNHLSEWSTTVSFTTQDAGISDPSITSPLDGAIDILKNVEVTTDAYTPFGHAETHASTDWQIASDIEFTTIVSESLADTVNLTSWTSGDLLENTTYYIRARYNSASYTSGWSATVSFTTKESFSDLPNTFGRIWNITDDVYQRAGLDYTSLSAPSQLEFTTWLSPSATRVNDDDTSTPSDLTTELDTNVNLPFSYIARKVVDNTGAVSTFDHSTPPTSTQQIMTEIPKCYYIDAIVVADGKEYDVKLTSIAPFSIDVVEDLGFTTITSITVFNPTAGISSGTVVGNVISSALHPAFAWTTGAEADFTYIGSFHSVSGRSTFGSGVRGTGNITLPTARTQHTSFGTNFNQHDFWNNGLVQLLAYIERGSNYLEQSGTKFDGYSWVSSASSYDQDNGLTLSLQNKTGVILDGSLNVIANSYRGIENYHSALYIWIDGININSGICYLAKAGSTFVSDIATAPYFDSGYVSTTTAAWQNINKWQAGTFIPSTTAGGTTASKVSDQMYGTTGWRVLLFGGNLNNAGISGLSAWLGPHGSSYSNWDFVSRASFRKFL